MKTETKRPMAGRARSLLKKVSAEIDSIPKYKGSLTGQPAETPLQMVSHSITAARRAIRFLKSQPSVSSLVSKRKKLEGIVKDAEEFKKMDFSGKPSGEMGKATTTLSKSAYLNKKRKERNR
tara:strand:+ start:725 stop:1090 length:366 start_codon:yes stop_codon:yes gene_type:complete